MQEHQNGGSEKRK